MVVIAAAALGFGNAVVDLLTLTGVMTIGYCIVRYYRNKLSQRDDTIKDREAKIRLLEHEIGSIEEKRNKAETVRARYRAQLGAKLGTGNGDATPAMRKLHNGNI